MKRKFLWFCTLTICIFIVTGCEPVSPERPQGTTHGEANAFQGAFSPEDGNSFVFEGEEYNLPFSYAEICELGWVISEDAYAEGIEYGINYSLPMEHEAYPGVCLALYVECWNGAYGDVESLRSELEKNGVWGIALQIDLEQVDIFDGGSSPAFEVNGIGLGSSYEDVIRVFGEGYNPNYTGYGIYRYETTATDGGVMHYYWLSFSFVDDILHEIHLTICC